LYTENRRSLLSVLKLDTAPDPKTIQLISQPYTVSILILSYIIRLKRDWFHVQSATILFI